MTTPPEPKMVSWYPTEDWNIIVQVPGRERIDNWCMGWPDNPKPNYVPEPDAELIDWLQHCYELLESGQEDRLTPDPFFVYSRGELTDEVVEAVIQGIDGDFAHEIKTAGGTHFAKSGAETTPDFGRLGMKGKRALVEGCAAIKEKWMRYAEEWLAVEAVRKASEKPVTPPPSYTSYDSGSEVWE